MLGVAKLASRGMTCKSGVFKGQGKGAGNPERESRPGVGLPLVDAVRKTALEMTYDSEEHFA